MSRLIIIACDQEDEQAANEAESEDTDSRSEVESADMQLDPVKTPHHHKLVLDTGPMVVWW